MEIKPLSLPPSPIAPARTPSARNLSLTLAFLARKFARVSEYSESLPRALCGTFAARVSSRGALKGQGPCEPCELRGMSPSLSRNASQLALGLRNEQLALGTRNALVAQ